MPYRLNPKDTKEVQVKKNKKWQRLMRHPSKGKAKGHLTALNINVKKH